MAAQLEGKVPERTVRVKSGDAAVRWSCGPQKAPGALFSAGEKMETDSRLMGRALLPQQQEFSRQVKSRHMKNAPQASRAGAHSIRSRLSPSRVEGPLWTVPIRQRPDPGAL